MQGPLHYAIIDEVDNILIDEARTPLIISGPAHDDVTRYTRADRIARQLRKGVDFEVNEKEHSAHLTDDGVRTAEQLAEVESFYTAGNMEWPHLIDNSLKAHHLYKRDVNYVVNAEGEVVIVDEFTGRLMPGRNWSDGLHQAVEAKEGVRVKEENQTLATITLQNFFKLYDKICGMTGTAMTEAGEFWKIYKLDVIAIPTNRNLRRAQPSRRHLPQRAGEIRRHRRRDRADVQVGRPGNPRRPTAAGRDRRRERRGRRVRAPRRPRAASRSPASKLRQVERRGRPILVGTVSIERSELISGMLDRRGVKHQVLNAKHHKREAEIVAQAGRKHAVTIATNMAGRGTDIILGGNPEAMAWAALQEKYPTRLEVPPEEWDTLVNEIEGREQTKPEGREVAAMGGLHIIGSERHEARRIDLQLRGRCGRQGDPGSSRFYLSLEDDLMRIFAGEWVKNVLTRLGMKEGEAIESRMVSRRIEGAQKKVEERNFEARKSLLEYDEVMDEQRKRVYGYRQKILDGGNCKQLILDMIAQQVQQHLDQCLARDYGTETFAEWAGKQFGVEFEARDFRGLDFNAAADYARDQAERKVEGQVLDAIEENLPDEADPKEWNWEALAKMANSRWHLNVRDRDLKQAGRQGVGELLIEKARAALSSVDLSDGAAYLAADFGLRAACGWVRHKFNIALPEQEVADLEPAALKALVQQRAEAAYQEKEVEYPVMAGLSHFSTRDPAGHKRYDREGLVAWAAERFHVKLDLDDLKNKQRDEIRALLIEDSRHYSDTARRALADAESRLAQVFNGEAPSAKTLRDAFDQGRLQSLSRWAAEELNLPLTPEKMVHLTPEGLRSQLTTAVEERYRPEMRKMERVLLLQLLDMAWKDHLLTMDHLRSSVGLRGYAQVDPKVEYKREGMKIFGQMWESIGERVTDLVFRMEELDEGFVGSTWTETEAIHEDGSAAGGIAEQQKQAIDGTQTDHKPQPIRNRQQRVGRNDPCPCGSGKKFKNCHMRK